MDSIFFLESDVTVLRPVRESTCSRFNSPPTLKKFGIPKKHAICCIPTCILFFLWFDPYLLGSWVSDRFTPILFGGRVIGTQFQGLSTLLGPKWGFRCSAQSWTSVGHIPGPKTREFTFMSTDTRLDPNQVDTTYLHTTTSHLTKRFGVNWSRSIQTGPWVTFTHFGWETGIFRHF